MPANHLLIIILTVVISGLAQVLLKMGATTLSGKSFTGISFDSLVSFITMFLNKYIFIGMMLYVFSATLWIWVLSKVDISLAYPFISLSFLITFGFGIVLFNEPLTNMKLMGTALIILGCFVITRT